MEEVEGRRRPPPLDPSEADELRHRTASAVRSSFPRRFTIAVVLLLVLIAGASVLLGRDEPSGDGVRAGTPNLVRIDLETEQQSSVTVGGTVTALTLGEGSVWLASHGDSAVYRLDPETMSVEARIPLPEPPQELAAGEGSIWVTTSQDLVRIDPTSDTTEQTFSLGRCTDVFDEDECQTDVTVGDGTVWATHYIDRRIVEVDATTRTEVRSRSLRGYPMAVTTGHGALWVLLHGPASVTVQRIDLATRDVSSETLPPRAIEAGCFGYGRFASLGELCVAIEAGERSVWVATPGEFNSELWRLDPITGDRVGDRLQLPCCVMAMSSSPELVPTIWVALSEDGVLTSEKSRSSLMSTETWVHT